MIGMLPVAAAATPGDARPAADPFASARSEMVATIRAQLIARGLRDDRRLRDILRVIGTLRREAFVPDDQRRAAYSMDPLPIGHGQTISDGFIQAYMTRMLNLRRHDRILEIGTGSGYQAAILGSLVDHVYTIEIVPELARRAAAALAGQGFRNVEVRQGDGYLGWPGEAPFDAIIVTAGAARIPPALFAQLRPGGRMILPLGPNWAEQQMTLVRKRRDGRADVSSCGWVFFVPFVGAAQTRQAGAPATWGQRLRPECFEPLGARPRIAEPPATAVPERYQRPSRR
ncbi:MAG TPA: protein-L-isoaspartate(D-aspartate) O-methyltransferase [Allosphingosinicella sp.]|nr:protein-L-isoaspartate(D-aspartate) O-methyltransferase [Allosphingosinicella sp.]